MTIIVADIDRQTMRDLIIVILKKGNDWLDFDFLQFDLKVFVQLFSKSPKKFYNEINIEKLSLEWKQHQIFDIKGQWQRRDHNNFPITTLLTTRKL